MRVSTLEELDQRDASACRGKIVFIDRRMARGSDGSGYGDAVPARSDGASRAARLGAVGVLIRSIGTDRNRLPHTGGLTLREGRGRGSPPRRSRFPDAELLTRLVRRGGPVRVRFELTCGQQPDAPSASVVGEVVGREKPDEIVLLGAHLDSWDLGTGAIDDGAGCGIVIEAARQIAALSPHPRRTIRVVLFANEENGLAGGKAYAKAHAAELARHVAALEADLGDGTAARASWNAGPSAEAMLKAIAGLTGALAAGQLKRREVRRRRHQPAGRRRGCPSLGLLLDASTYFDLAPHRQRHARQDRSRDPGPLDGGLRGRGLRPGRDARDAGADPRGRTRAGAGLIRAGAADGRRRRARGGFVASRLAAAPPSPLDAATAERFAALALTCVDREFPNKPEQVIESADDVRAPKQFHPAFFGCYDWHSSVHGHWLLARLLKTHPGDRPPAARIRARPRRALHPGRDRGRDALPRPEGQPRVRTAVRLGVGAAPRRRPRGLFTSADDPQARAWRERFRRSRTGSSRATSRTCPS